MTEHNGICQISLINEGKVRSVRESMLRDEIFSSLAETFKALGDTTRVRILFALSGNELCVCDLSAVLDMSVSAISHQLRVLRNMNLVKYRKDGKMAYYSLCDDHVTELIDLGLIHVTE